MTGRRVIASITFMLRTIPQKDTLNRLSGQLGPLTRGKQNIACTSEDSEMIIVWRSTKKYFTRTFAKQFG